MSSAEQLSVRKFSRRAILGGLAVGTAGVLLAACGGAVATSPPAQSGGAASNVPAASTAASGVNANAGAPASLLFWASVRGGTEFIDASQKLCTQFTQANPGITVKWEGVASQGWYEKYTTAIASGTGPDVATGTAYQAFQFYDTKNILPVDDIVADWKSRGILEKFRPNVIDLQRYDNHYIALPWAFDIRVAYYRKDLFDQAGVKPPTNWDEWRAAAKALTKGDVYGQVISGDTLGWHNQMFFQLGNGGGPFTKEKKVDLATNPRNVEAAQHIANLVKDGSVNPAGVGYISDDALKSFSSGKAGMYIANPQLERRLPDIADKIGLMAPITSPNNTQGTVFWINNSMAFNYTKAPAAAKTFLGWWTLNNLSLWTAGQVQVLPVIKAFADDPYIRDNPNANFILDKYLPIGRPVASQFEGLFPQLNTFEGDGTLITLNQDILSGKSPVEALKKAHDAVKKIMGEA